MKKLGKRKHFGISRPVALAPVLVSCGLTVSAADYYIRDAVHDWTDPKNYTMDAEGTTTADIAPGAGGVEKDAVIVLEGRRVYVDSVESLEVVNKLDRIRPKGSNSEIVFSVSEGCAWTNKCPINYDGVGSRIGSANLGKVIKQGTGILELESRARYKTGSYNVDYDTSFVVDKGTLILPQKTNGGSGVLYSYKYTVANDATLVLTSAYTAYPCLMDVATDALVTNYTGTASVYVIGDSAVQSIIAGRVQGKISMSIAGKVDFTGMGNAFSELKIFNRDLSDSTGRGTVGVATFGLASSILLATEGNGAEIKYLGSGETTSAALAMYNGTKSPNTPVIVNAGDKGGVVFNGEWKYAGTGSANVAGFREVRLAGENVDTPAVMNGKLVETTFGGTNYSFLVRKVGTGIWKFGDTSDENKSRTTAGTYMIDSGTLQYESIAKKYDVCSLGLSTNLYSAYSGWRDPAKRVDWAISIGSADAEGTLEYVGSEDVAAWSRPIVFRGNARLRNSSATGKTRYLALASEATKAMTLTLDGDNVSENEVCDVIDSDNAPISVVKDGLGKWVVSGDLAFRGAVNVKKGELVIRKYPLKYSWYRMNVTKKNDPMPGQSQDNNFSIMTFGLYDANGNWQCQDVSEAANFASLQPGQAAIEVNRKRTYSSGDRDFLNMFQNNTGTYGWYVTFYDIAGTRALMPTVGDPVSHISFETRLTNGAPEIVSYDVALPYGSGTAAGYHRGAGAWSLEGSVDGMHWENLDNVTEVSPVSPSPFWVYAQSQANWSHEGPSASSLKRHTGGKAIEPRSKRSYAALASVGEVSVSSGASLIGEGGEFVLSHLTVSAKGAGRIVGFAFSSDERSKLDVIDAEDLKGKEIALGLDLSQCGATIGNIGDWSLTINGKPSTRQITVKNGRITIKPNGILLIVR